MNKNVGVVVVCVVVDVDENTRKEFFVFDATPSRHEFDKRYEIYISNYLTLCIHILIVVIDILITIFIFCQ